MIDDMSKVDPVFKPGNYWKFYEKNILKQILDEDLDLFRSMGRWCWNWKYSLIWRI